MFRLDTNFQKLNVVILLHGITKHVYSLKFKIKIDL